MGFLTNQNQQAQQVPERQALETKFANSRHNILIVLIFTVINILLLVTNSNSYFLFSAYIPYLFADLGMYLCGKYPAEFYSEEYALTEFLPGGFLAVMLVIAAVILALYLLSWMFTKKGSKGWMVFALVFFSVDTGVMFFLNGISTDMIFDVVLHAWVIYSLASGVSVASKLEKLPAEPEPAPEEQTPEVPYGENDE